MKTNHAKAKSTNAILCRISGTRTAARRLLIIAVVVEACAGGRERLPRGLRKRHVAELQTLRERAAGLYAAENLDPVERLLQKALFAQRLRRDDDGGVPLRQPMQVDDGDASPKVPDVARFLRITAAVRQSTGP